MKSHHTTQFIKIPFCSSCQQLALGSQASYQLPLVLLVSPRTILSWKGARILQKSSSGGGGGGGGVGWGGGAGKGDSGVRSFNYRSNFEQNTPT